MDLAKERLDKLRKMASSLDEKWLYACLYRSEACIAMKEGRYEEAKEKLVRSIALWRDLKIRFFEGRDLLLLASVHHDHGDLSEANQCLNMSMELFTQIGAKIYAQMVLSKKELLKA